MDNLIPIHKAAKRLGATTQTLRRWDKTGKLPALRSPGGHRMFREEDILALQGVRLRVPHRNVLYCRVSDHAQKADLKNQIESLQVFALARGLTEIEIISEIGGGMNLRRKKFLSLMDSVERLEVKTLTIAHRDRLARFGFGYFERFCTTHGCELLVLNQERLSPESEVVQDLLAIIHTFSSRLHGLRGYKRKLREALK